MKNSLFPAPRFRLEVMEECGSTNEVLLGYRDRPDFHGRALLALRQTAGVGRRGRQWWDGEGNLALSLALRLEQAEGASLLPFLAGLALVDALPIPAGHDLRLKWPNDLYLNGRKLSGLLAQARQSPDGTDLVLGIGLNLQSAPPDPAAIALKEIMDPPTPQAFAPLFLEKFHTRLRCSPDFSAIRDPWEKAARLRESELLIVGEEGVWRGESLLPTGELEVFCGGERRTLASETVSLRIRR